MEIELTGHWNEPGELLRPGPGIQTNEPPLRDRETREFSLSFAVPTDGCILRMEYDPSRDVSPDRALDRNDYTFNHCWLNGERQLLMIENRHNNKIGRLMRYIICNLSKFRAGAPVRLKWVWPCTRPPVTRLISPAPIPADSRFQAIRPVGGEALLLVRGVPFLTRAVRYFYPDHDLTAWQRPYPPGEPERGELAPWEKGASFACFGARARRAYFLGMIHRTDIGNSDWAVPAGEYGFSRFAGDHAGDIVITWQDGLESVIPLVFGFNLWFSRPWDTTFRDMAPYYSMMFGGRPENLNIIRDGLYLVDGIRSFAPESCSGRYVFAVDLDPERPITSLAFRGVPNLHGYPLISAVTLETESSSRARTGTDLPVLPSLALEDPAVKAIDLPSIAQRRYELGIKRIQRLLYVHRDQLPKLRTPEIPKGYFGPHYDFQGAQEAVYAATYLYRNAPECAAYIADSGMGGASPVSSGITGYYHLGLGIWFDRKAHFQDMANWFELYKNKASGQFPGVNSTWARGAGQLLREAMAFGYDKFAGTYTEWLDRCLMTDNFPPHWGRCPGTQQGAFQSKVGDQVERGVRENDGHGNCMWGRYMVFHWLGRERGQVWNEKHFEATRASVEWIQWMLDTDLLRPGFRKDVLYSESECVYGGGYEIYSSYACLHGIKLAIRLAAALDKTVEVERWTRLYRRLRFGILDHLVDDSASGPIWHVAPQSWATRAHQLVHLHLATEGDTYTPLQDYATTDEIERRYLEISRNSYRHLMRGGSYDFLQAYGYGQGMMAQAALLLDEMRDAEQFIALMLNHCYLPHLAGWAAPEGIVRHRNGEYYMPVNGYAGQDSHVADSAKAIRLMLGVDDNRPEHLRLAPRYQASWTKMIVRDFPVLTGVERQKMAYTYVRQGRQQSFTFAFERAVENLSIRLGPITAGQPVERALINGQPHPFRREHSGDSDWVWIEGLSGKKGLVELI